MLLVRLQEITGIIEGDALKLLKTYYDKLKKQNKFLLIAIDEFGKLLEHAAKNDPEEELYFIQKLCQTVNVPNRNILLLTTLHQNFSSYSRKLNTEQKNEWTKVKGRFQEVVSAEPIEQLLFLAAEHISTEYRYKVTDVNFNKITDLINQNNEKEYKTWIEKLKLATGYTNLLDIYEIKDKLGNGKFNDKNGSKLKESLLQIVQCFFLDIFP